MPPTEPRPPVQERRLRLATPALWTRDPGIGHPRGVYTRDFTGRDGHGAQTTLGGITNTGTVEVFLLKEGVMPAPHPRRQP